MAEKEPIKEDAPPGVPAWMLTFCDCMTLLLTFFVLLLSFSSFDESTKKRLNGAMKFKATPTSINKNRDKIDDALAMQIAPIEDRTDKGAETKRPSDSVNVVRNPKKVEPLPETDAYHQETVLSIPLEELFRGNSVVLTSWGSSGLDRIASYLKVMPSCYVIIGESLSHRASSRPVDSANMRLVRPWTVLQFLRQRRNLPAERFWISRECPRPKQAKKDQSTMQIVLLAKDITR